MSASLLAGALRHDRTIVLVLLETVLPWGG